MNKKGSVLMTIIVALAFFMFGILIIGLLFGDIAYSKSSDSLDCSNQSIRSGNKLSCIGIDIIVPGWIIVLVLIGGGAIVYELVKG